MARLTLTLLGGFEARLDEGRALRLSIKKGQALLAYLAMPAGKPHLRDKLATLLWGDLPELSARKGLRQTLFTLGRLLGEANPLRLEGEAVTLDLALVATDVAELETCAAEGARPALERAANLYGGDLLKGLSVREPGFEEWLVGERLRLRELAVDAMARLLAQQRDAGPLEAAVQTALRIVALDPVREPVHRALMRLHMELGRRGEALRQYQLCVSALQRELRAEPDAETKALYRELLQRRLVAAAAPAEGGGARAAFPSPLPAVGPPASESPLVGRERELGQLRNALATAWTGELRVVSLIGEAGIGKSRLAAELTVEAARTGGRALAGHCYESEQVLPFGPWIDALRSSRLVEDEAMLGTLGPVWRAELARLLPEVAAAPAGSPAADPAALFEAIAQLLERVARMRPLVLVLEDVHWADEMSLRLLAFIGRRLGQSRTLVVVTVREENLEESPLLRHALDELDQERRLVRCRLGPLGRKDTMALARTLVPSGDALPVEEQLWRASEGNPFMVVETLRAQRGGRTPADSSALPLPDRVRNLIAHRIRRLGEGSRRLVAIAAVIGRPFEWPLLERAAAAGGGDPAEGVEELVRQRILQSCAEGFEFTHDRIREVAHDELLAPRRALIHRDVAEALEALHGGDLDPHALAVGTHYRAGHVWPKAVHFLACAGMQAARRYAQRDAVVCYEQALAALDRLPESRETREQEADLRYRLAHSLYRLVDLDRTTKELRLAEARSLVLGDQRRLGEIYATMAYVSGSAGDFAEAARTGLRALTIATSLGQADLRVWTSLGLARVHYAQGSMRQVIECARSVADALATGGVADVSLDERFGRGGVLPSVACRGWLALGLAGTGDFPEALAWGRESVRVAEAVGGPPGEVFAAYCLSRVHLARGDEAEAIPLLEKAIPLCETRVPLYTPAVLAALGWARAMGGDLDVALSLLDRALAEARAINLLYGQSIILSWTAAAHLEIGQFEEAEGHASTALDLARRYGARGEEATALHVLGEIAARRTPPDGDLALARSVQALALAEALDLAPLEARCHLSLGALHQRQGRLTDARTELSQAVEMLGRMQMRYWLRTAESLRFPTATTTSIRQR